MKTERNRLQGCAHQRQSSLSRKGRDPSPQRAFGTNAIKNERCAGTRCEFSNVFGRRLITVEGAVCTVLLGEHQMRRIVINRDDLGRAKGSEELHSKESQAADPNDGCRCAGREGRQCRLDCCISRQPGVGKRCRQDWIKVSHWNCKPCLDEHKFRESTIQTYPCANHSVNVEAKVLFAPSAWRAVAAAAPQRHNCYGLANLEPDYSLSDRFDPSGDLMPEGERRRGVKPLCSRTLHQADVGVAQAASAHLDQELARTGLGFGHVLKCRRLLRLEQPVRNHSDPPCDFVL